MSTQTRRNFLQSAALVASSALLRSRRLLASPFGLPIGLQLYSVREMLAKVPAHVGRDELTSAGMVALVVSAKGFDASRGVPFARFAAIRIRRALMDELRSMDWAARSVRGRAREVETVRSTGALIRAVEEYDLVFSTARIGGV